MLINIWEKLQTLLLLVLAGILIVSTILSQKVFAEDLTLDCRWNVETQVTICVPMGKWTSANSAGFVPIRRVEPE